ncbi:MAG: nickel pincer cofactor biosynthesis protein LarB [Myxococcales bacterium]|nr:nickel pincer cofactor biosynthesis protein LarB [Myxococcales bacterium]
MNDSQIRALLGAVASKSMSVDAAVDALKQLPFQDLGFAKLDHHRAVRCGFPEVVFGEGKTPEQLLAICEAITKRGMTLLATRVEPAAAATVTENLDVPVIYDQASRCLYWEAAPTELVAEGTISVIAAGTSDLPVAAEAELTARLMGNPTKLIIDVGVAGLHRLLGQLDQIHSSSVLIVVAGMEGALPSVVSGLVDKPVIAVPTSVGYGTARGGMTALHAMLTSCATGITVVNIDNGFGAGYAAALMNRIKPLQSASDQ